MESLVGLGTYVALSPIICQMVDEFMGQHVFGDMQMVRAVRKVAGDTRKSVFDADVRCYPSHGHTHTVVRNGRTLRLIGSHEHVIELEDSDMKTLAEHGLLHLQSSVNESWDHSSHSHKVIISV